MSVEVASGELTQAPSLTSVGRLRNISASASSYMQLTKPRITVLIVLTSAAGFCLGAAGPVDYRGLVVSMLGIAILSSGIACLNQYVERDLDSKMRRTANRPIPSGRIMPVHALAFGLVLTIAAEVYLLIFVNALTSLLGVAVIFGYLLLYTPLKTRSSLSTIVGAFPGAIPPMIGWTATGARLTLGAWVLFAIMFLWQCPHFLAIAWMYRKDYARAGIAMLPVVEPRGSVTRRQIVLWTLMLLPVSLLPAILSISGKLYFFGALALGALYLWGSASAAITLSRSTARRLLLVSIIYLPLLFGLMVLDR